MSRRNAMPSTTISTIPEELRQEIISYLNYDDAWSLKKASALFYRVVEIPTIKSFLACPYGPSLGMLEEWQIIPLGYEACFYCSRLLPKERFSRFQRHLTAARQHALEFDYDTWNREKHYCLECGVKHHLYPGGRRIYIGFGDPGYKDEAVIPCDHCGSLVDYQTPTFVICPSCHGVSGADGLSSLSTQGSSSSNPHLKVATTSDKEQSEGVTEPERKAYEDAEPGSLLALIGERLIC